MDENSKEVRDAVNALKSHANYLERLHEQLQNAESDKDIRGVWSSLQEHDEGDRPDETANWAFLRLQDYFRNRGMWDDDQRYPDINQEET